MRQESIGSRMSLAGHPIHPTLIHFPVAALLGIFATDATFLYTGDAFWARGGFWLSTVGTFGGWLAGGVGFIDLLSVRSINQLIRAWSHAILAVMTLSLASLNWLMRLDDAGAHIFPWGIYLSGLTAAMLVVTGILGGQLVYEHGVGVDAEDE